MFDGGLSVFALFMISFIDIGGGPLLTGLSLGLLVLVIVFFVSEDGGGGGGGAFGLFPDGGGGGGGALGLFADGGGGGGAFGLFADGGRICEIIKLEGMSISISSIDSDLISGSRCRSILGFLTAKKKNSDH